MIDTHAHLNFPGLAEEVSTVIKKAREAGVEEVIVPGTSLETSISSVDISNRYREVYAAVGVHPTDYQEVTPAVLNQLKEIAGANKKVVAIGEVGLDFYRQEDEKDMVGQEKVFREMISVAGECSLPLIIHTRAAFQSTLAILREVASMPTVIHCFTGSREEAYAFLDLGCLISFTGTLTFKKNDELRNVAKSLPLDRILIETDAPFLAPEGKRGQRSEPADVRAVAECLAQVRGIPFAEVDQVTTRSARRFFNLEMT